MNNITTLRTHLFDQLQRLKNATGEELKTEIDKSKAIISVSAEILNTAKIEAEVIKSVKQLHSGFVPDVINHVINKQLEEKEKPYEFQTNNKSYE